MEVVVPTTSAPLCSLQWVFLQTPTPIRNKHKTTVAPSSSSSSRNTNRKTQSKGKKQNRKPSHRSNQSKYDIYSDGDEKFGDQQTAESMPSLWNDESIFDDANDAKRQQQQAKGAPNKSTFSSSSPKTIDQSFLHTKSSSTLSKNKTMIKRKLQDITNSQPHGNHHQQQEEMYKTPKRGKQKTEKVTEKKLVSESESKSPVRFTGSTLKSTSTVSNNFPVCLVDPFEFQHREEMQEQALSEDNLFSSNDTDEFEPLVFDFRVDRAPFKLETKKASAVTAITEMCNTKTSLVLRKNNSMTTASSEAIKKGVLLLGDGEIGPGAFVIGKFLGGGTYGSVFSIKKQSEKKGSSSSSASSSPPLAMKIETGVRHLPWELHILRKLHRSCTGFAEEVSPGAKAFRAAELLELIVSPQQLVLYRDVCCLLLPQASGNLDKVLWHSRRAHCPFSQYAAAYYVSRMLRAVEILFGSSILHGDLKLDNFVISPRNNNSITQKSISSSTASPVRLTLIDFGRSLDLTAYDSSTRFAFNKYSIASFGNAAVRDFVPSAQWSTDGWLHELDCHALAVLTMRLTQPSSQSSNNILMRNQNEAKATKGQHSGNYLKYFNFTRGWEISTWSNFVADMLNPNQRMNVNSSNKSSNSAKYIRLLRQHRQKFESIYCGHEIALHAELNAHLRLVHS